MDQREKPKIILVPGEITSLWWQMRADENNIAAPALATKIMVAMDIFSLHGDKFLLPYRMPVKDATRSVELEIPQCFSRQYCGLGFYTGIAPFLSHVRFLATEFSRHPEAKYTLVASARSEELLRNMFYDELCELKQRFPNNFRYIPVATREWGDMWHYPKGRVMKAERNEAGALAHVDLGPLLALIPDLGERHIRLCGGKEPRDWFRFGLQEYGITPPSFKSEVW